MMTNTAKSILCLTLLIGMLGLNAFGDAKKPAPTRGRVIAVDLAAKQLTLESSPGSAPQKCVVTDQSTIEINNKTSTLKQVKNGLWIRSMRLDSSSPPVVEDLDLTTKG